MPCKIIAQASTRYAAKYQVQTHGRVYEARVEDHPGEDCVVHIVRHREGVGALPLDRGRRTQGLVGERRRPMISQTSPGAPAR